jgi:hypothetical protein
VPTDGPACRRVRRFDKRPGASCRCCRGSARLQQSRPRCNDVAVDRAAVADVDLVAGRHGAGKFAEHDDRSGRHLRLDAAARTDRKHMIAKLNGAFDVTFDGQIFAAIQLSRRFRRRTRQCRLDGGRCWMMLQSIISLTVVAAQCRGYADGFANVLRSRWTVSGTPGGAMGGGSPKLRSVGSRV